MKINELLLDEIEELNELQKYFYEHLKLFVYKLDGSYFDLKKTFFQTNLVKRHYSLKLKLIPKRQDSPEIDIYINTRMVTISIDGWHEELEYINNSFVEFYESFEKLLFFAFESFLLSRQEFFSFEF